MTYTDIILSREGDGYTCKDVSDPENYVAPIELGELKEHITEDLSEGGYTKDNVVQFLYGMMRERDIDFQALELYPMSSENSEGDIRFKVIW